MTCSCPAWNSYRGTEEVCDIQEGNSIFIDGVWLYGFSSYYEPPNPLYGESVLTVVDTDPSYNAEWFTFSAGDEITVVTDKEYFADNPIKRIQLKLLFTGYISLYNTDITPLLVGDKYEWTFIIPLEAENLIFYEITAPPASGDKLDSFYIYDVRSSLGGISSPTKDPQLMEMFQEAPF
jgi:hypothetical protein